MVLRAKFLYVLVLAVILGSVLVSPGLVNGVDTYYGDFTSSTLLEKVGTVRKWEVTNQTSLVILEGNSNFFIAKGDGSGSVESSISNNTSYINLNIHSGIYAEASIIHNYNPQINWSQYNYLNVTYGIDGTQQLGVYIGSNAGQSSWFLHGDNRGVTNTKEDTINLSIPDSGDILNKFYIDWLKMFYGWSTSQGDLRIYKMELLSLIVGGETYYQVWDGSTLKYQGLINPDIEDFSAVSVAEPILGFTFIALAFSGLAVTIFYWVSKRLVLGLLSVLVMLGTGFYWLILSTALPILAWIWILIGLVNLVDFVIRVIFIFGDQIADEYGYRWDFLRNKGDD